MELFSHRKGIKPIKSAIQAESIDDDLCNRLWDALTFYWSKVTLGFYPNSDYIIPDERDILLKRLWHSYYKRPIDAMPDSRVKTYTEIREYFFNCKWFGVCDLSGFAVNSYLIIFLMGVSK